MNGYQPKKRCSSCLKFDTCNKKHKNRVCKKYKACQPLPPTGGSCVTPIYTPPIKQRTVLSVRDFAILYELANYKIKRCEIYAEDKARVYVRDDGIPTIDEEKKKCILEQDIHYQDLLRIREKLGKLNIEIETPSVEVEK